MITHLLSGVLKSLEPVARNPALSRSFDYKTILTEESRRDESY